MVSLVSGSKAGAMEEIAHDYIVVDEISTASNYMAIIAKEKFKEIISDIRTGSLTIGKWYMIKNKTA